MESVKDMLKTPWTIGKEIYDACIHPEKTMFTGNAINPRSESDRNSGQHHVSRPSSDRQEKHRRHGHERDTSHDLRARARKGNTQSWQVLDGSGNVQTTDTRDKPRDFNRRAPRIIDQSANRKMDEMNVWFGPTIQRSKKAEHRDKRRATSSVSHDQDEAQGLSTTYHTANDEGEAEVRLDDWRGDPSVPKIETWERYPGLMTAVDENEDHSKDLEQDPSLLIIDHAAIEHSRKLSEIDKEMKAHGSRGGDVSWVKKKHESAGGRRGSV